MNLFGKGFLNGKKVKKIKTELIKKIPNAKSSDLIDAKIENTTNIHKRDFKKGRPINLHTYIFIIFFYKFHLAGVYVSICLGILMYLTGWIYI